MRKLYNEFFYIPKHGKIREKVMLTRIASTIAIVIMCLAAMSITAYAYFSYNITSGSNIIKAAHFETNVSVQIRSSDGETVEVRTSNHISHAAALTGGETYYITLQHTARSTAKTGFVIITAKNCDSKYHTQQISRNDDGTTKTVTFYLVPSADTEVTFYSHWGTSSFYPDFKDVQNAGDLYVRDGETIEMSIKGALLVGGEESKNPTSDSKTTKTEGVTRPQETTTATTSSSTAPPVTETTSAQTTSPTQSRAPKSTTEPTTAELTVSTDPSEPTSTIAPTATEETQPASETTGATTTEANE